MLTPHVNDNDNDIDNDSDNDSKNDNNITTYNSIALHIPALHIAYECVHAHNVRDFSQAKLDKEINARFHSNEHNDLYIFIA